MQEEETTAKVDTKKSKRIKIKKPKKKVKREKQPAVEEETRTVVVEDPEEIQRRKDEEERKRKKEEARPLTAAEIQAILGEDAEVPTDANWVKGAQRRNCVRDGTTDPGRSRTRRMTQQRGRSVTATGAFASTNNPPSLFLLDYHRIDMLGFEEIAIRDPIGYGRLGKAFQPNGRISCLL